MIKYIIIVLDSVKKRKVISKNGKECKTTMCKKLDELNGLTSEMLLEKAKQSNVFPVDVAQICYNLGIWLQPFDFTSIEKESNIHEQVKQKGHILGAVLVNNNDLAILYRKYDSTNRKRFTIAHELAHCCLHMNSDEKRHIEFRIDEQSSDKKEIEANTFAGELLIPEKALKKIIGESKYLSIQAMKTLSNIFMVSENVMKARLEKLNINLLI